MTHRAALAVILALSALVSSGCATIMNGATQKVFFDSEPQGAEIEYSGKTYTTPCLISLAKYYKGLKLPIYKTGYLPQEIECKVKIGGWSWANVAFPFIGIVGVIVDGCTAATLDYVEENHRVTLVPVDEIAAQILDDARVAAKKAAEEKHKRDEHVYDDGPMTAHRLKHGL